MTRFALVETRVVGFQFQLDERADAVDFVQRAFDVVAACIECETAAAACGRRRPA